MELEIILVVIWILSPIFLIPSNIILYKKCKNLQNNLNIEKVTEIKPVVKVKNKSIKVNPFNITLTIGVLLVIISGIVFAVTNWGNMSGNIKTLIVFLSAIIFYIIGIVSEKKFRLPKISIAFFTLGSLFLPISLVSIGYFKILGEWFAFSGNGINTIMMSVFTLLAITEMYNTIKYNSKIFASVTLASLSLASFFAINGILYGYNLKWLYPICFMLYSFLVLNICKNVKYHKRFIIFKDIINEFIIGNTFFFNITTLFYSGELRYSTGVALVVFALIYLSDIFTKKSIRLGTLPFSLFIIIGYLELLDAQSFMTYMSSLCLTVMTITVIVSLKFINSDVKKSLCRFSIIITFLFLIISFISKTNQNFYPEVFTITSSTIILFNVIWLDLKHKNYAAHIISSVIACSLAYNLSAAISDNYYNIYFAILIVLFLIFYSTKLRSIMSDVIFIFFCLTQNMTIGNYKTIEVIVGSVALAYMLIMLAINGSKRIRSVTASYFIVPALFSAVRCLMDISDNPHVPARICYTIMVILVFTVPLFNSENIPVFRMMKGIEIWLYVICFYNLYDIDFPYFFILCIFNAVNGTLFHKTNVDITQNYFYAYSVMISFTIGTLISLGGNIRDSILLLCFDGIIFMSSYFLSYTIKKESIIWETFYRFAHFLLNITFIIEIFNRIINGHSDEPVWLKATYYTFLAVLMVITYICSHMFKGNNFSAAVSATSFTTLFYLIISQHYNYTDGKILLVVITIFLISISIGKSVHKFFSKRKNYTDWFTAVSVIPVLIFTWNSLDGNKETIKWNFFSWIMLSIYTLTFFNKNNHQIKNKTLISTSVFFVFIALGSQKLIPINNIFHREIIFILVISYSMILCKIWEKYRNIFSRFAFVVSTVNMITLAYDIINYKILLDSQMFIVLSTIMLIVSFIKKYKKWLCLASLSLVFITIYTTRDFWLSIDWWIYLLIIGISLISLAAVNEKLHLKKITYDKFKYRK